MATPIHSSLVLDHFFLSFSEDDFNELHQLLGTLKELEHRATQSGDDEWEGLYLRSSIGSYFEALKGEEYSLGIALSPWRMSYVDASLITKEMPKIKWKSTPMYQGSSKKIWFEAIMPKPAPDAPTNDPSVWIMHYHPIHSPNMAKPRVPSQFDRFTTAKIQMHPDFRAGLEAHQTWFPGKMTIKSKQTRLALTERDGTPFEIVIDWNSRMERAVELIGLRGHAHPLSKPMDLATDQFRLIKKDGELFLLNQNF